jgi:hypothetical protein
MVTLLLPARCIVQISATLLAIVTEIFHGFPQSLHINAEEVAKNMTASVDTLPYLLFTNYCYVFMGVTNNNGYWIG